MNPFKIFAIEEKFEITELDEKYFLLFRTSYNKEELNAAYKMLKDPIERAKTLCKINGYTTPDQTIAKEVLNIKATQEILTQIYNMVIENAINNQWDNTWKYLQKYSYIKRMLGSSAC